MEVPTLLEYWNDDRFFGQDFVRASGRNRTRFMNILTTLHLCDFELDRQNEITKSRKEPCDHLFKLKPIINDIQLACRSHFVPDQNISIDERMVAFKGRIEMKQYIKTNQLSGVSSYGYLLVLIQATHSNFRCILGNA